MLTYTVARRNSDLASLATASTLPESELAHSVNKGIWAVFCLFSLLLALLRLSLENFICKRRRINSLYIMNKQGLINGHQGSAVGACWHKSCRTYLSNEAEIKEHRDRHATVKPPPVQDFGFEVVFGFVF